MNTIRKNVRVFCLAVTVIVLLVSFTPLVPSVAGQLATDWYQGDADALVVLGGGMLVSGTGPNATLGYDSYLRCTYAWWNIQRFKYSYIVLTGNDGVAEAMAALLREKGANARSIFIENQAASTLQNAQFVKRLLESLHLPANSRIAILTSDYHCRRAQQVFRKVFEGSGVEIRVVPVPDLGKQPNSPTARWGGFFTLSSELGKYIIYAVNGRLRF